MVDCSGEIVNSSQEQRILHVLLASWPAWVPALTLSHVSLQYNARIFGLRRRGWQIESRLQIVKGIRHGSFRLARPGDFPNPKNKDTQPQSRLFKEERHRDDG